IFQSQCKSSDSKPTTASLSTSTCMTPPIPPYAKRPSTDWYGSTAAAGVATTNATACRLVALPDDILVAFLFALPIPDMLRFAATCRDIHKLTLDPEFWRMLTINAGLDVDNHGVGHSSDGEETPIAIPNTVAAYKSKLVDAIRTRVPAYNSFHGAWMGGESPHISPRPDPDAIHGQALGVNVWWLEVCLHAPTSFLIEFDLFLTDFLTNIPCNRLAPHSSFPTAPGISSCAPNLHATPTSKTSTGSLKLCPLLQTILPARPNSSLSKHGK
ncbi:hypothetical protein BCR44DRAFT_194800, partial [Catenaria anguillulae PL171]